ncbi:MAG TPA: VWA domain-containing protein, partial [Xanthomonadaceae bacterium]|nr:VWA domain-containing protein [Xanthomonadaceae bacterium]
QFRADHTPREVTLIVDTSGSMRGAAMEQARAALRVALAALAAQDRFNVIEFNNFARALFEAPVRAETAELAAADRFVGALQANGGTQMLPALEKAMQAPPSPGFLRQMVFITDGSVGNEEQVLAQIRRDIGNARLFTVGIGHGVNGHFLRKAADFGRGSHTLIAHQDQVEERMIELLTRLTSPVLHDIDLAWPARAEAFPQRVPDLYTGEPLLVLARLPASAGVAKASGLSDGKRWQRTLSLDSAIDVPGVASLWARRRIESLLDARGNGSDPEWIRTEVTATALQYQLLSPYTSMVAVEHMPARPDLEPLHAHNMPQNLPHGRQIDGIMGGGRAMPGTVAGAASHMHQGLMLLVLAIVLVAARRVLRT